MKTFFLPGRRLRLRAFFLAGILAAGLPARADPTSPGDGSAAPATNAGPARADLFYPDRPEDSAPPANPQAAPSLTFRPLPAAPGQALPATPFFIPEGDPQFLADHLLVVYNSAYPSSKDLAGYYARCRNIPAERVLGLACPTTEEISRDDFEETIREPIVVYLYRKNWMSRHSMAVNVGGRMLDLLVADHNDIWAIVLMRGMPLKIAEDPADTATMQRETEFQTNAAAVDSELALLPIFGLPRGGFVANPFFDKNGDGLLRVGPEIALKMILVTRLDGPRASDVRRMIDDSLYAESHRLAGIGVIDTRGLTDPHNPFTVGDDWLRNSSSALLHDGWCVDMDSQPDVLPPTYPVNDVALYLGWYRDGAYGPWVTPPDRFVRGAIAYHLHSYSGRSVRDPNAGWVGALIAHGAAASLGTVYEPYLFLTPQLDIFTRRLLQGDSFGEAAYACQRALSWMTTVVGDPLYRPFLQPLETALAQPVLPDDAEHHDWLLLQQVRREILAGTIPATVAALEQSLSLRDSGGVAQEGLGDLLEKLHESDAPVAAEGAYRTAENLDTEPVDRVRVGIKLAEAYRRDGQPERAQDELAAIYRADPADASRFGLADPSTLPPVVSNGNATSGPAVSPTLPRAPGPPAPPKP